MHIPIAAGAWQRYFGAGRQNEEGAARALSGLETHEVAAGLTGRQQSDGDDSLRIAERSRLHGDPEHPEICKSREKYQKQSYYQSG